MQKTQKKQEKDSNIIRTFSIASFLNDLGSDMVFPIWPLFVTTVLNANVAVLGLIDGLGNAIVSISQALSGYVSDRLGKRKVFIWTGYLFGSLSRVGYSLSRFWELLIPLKILDRSGKIRGAPRDAMVADASTRENRGRNFGLLRTMDNLGAVCGILISISLLGTLGYRNLFLLASIPSIVSAVLVYVFIKERKIKGIYSGFSLKDLNIDFKLFLLSSSLFATGFFSYSFLLVYAKEFGFQDAYVPVLYLIFTVIASLMSFNFGKLADRFNRKKVLFLSYVFFMLICLGFIYVNSFSGIILLFVVYGLHLAAKEPVQVALISELSPKKYKASTLGTFQMVTGLCAFPASFVAGLLWVTFDKFMPFYFSLFLTVASIVLLIFVKEPEKKL